jgi:PAS domain S-box-containing protein
MEIGFSRLFDALPALVWTAFPDGRADLVSRRWCEYTGLSADEALGEGWQAAVHPEDRGRLVESWRAATQSGQPGELEARLLSGEGTYRRFLFRFSPLADGAGDDVKWCAVNTDIEDAKRREEALQARGSGLERAEALLAGEKRLLQMVARGSALPDVLDALCHVVEGIAGGSLCSILTIDPDSIRFRHGAGPSLPTAYNEVLDGLIMDRYFGPCGMAANLKMQVIASDVASDPRWTASPWPGMVVGHGLRSCWSTPILSRNDEVIGVFALYQHQPSEPTAGELDIVSQFAHLAGIAIERAEGDAALRRSEARKAAMLDSSLDCIISIDHEARVTEFNAAAEQIFGYREDQVVGELLAEIIVPPRYREQHRQGFARYLATGESRLIGRHTELTAIRADGTEFPVELAIARLPTDGPPAFTGFLRDLSDRKRSEEALGKVRAELSRMARVTSLGALTASIAHEVNQPLSGIITNASTCLKMLAAEPPNVQGAQETARRTVRDGNRAADIIKRLRALFANKEAAGESMDLGEAASEVIALCASDLQRVQVAVRQDFADQLPPITADRVQIQQVIQNLLMNAVDAVSNVEDRPRQISIATGWQDADHLRLSVRDSGAGIDAEAAARLFEAFYTTKSEGMGIGLSVSRSIIENHGGRLWAEPNDGPGATFAFSVPCRSDGDASGAPVLAPPAAMDLRLSGVKR